MAEIPTREHFRVEMRRDRYGKMKRLGVSILAGLYANENSAYRQWGPWYDQLPVRLARNLMEIIERSW